EILQAIDDRITAITIAGGVGASKSFLLTRYLLPEIVFANEVRGLNGWPASERLYCWLVGPLYENTRAEFKYMLDAIRNTPEILELVGGFANGPSMPSIGSWSMTLGNGVEIATKSWLSEETLHSVPVYLAGVCEAGQLTEPMWLKRIYPRVARAHGVAVEAGTFEANTCFKKHFAAGLSGDPARRSWALATWDNTKKYPGGRNDPAILAAEREYADAPEQFEERYGAIPSKPVGLVHRYMSLTHHVRPVQYQPNLPLKVWIDPGSMYAVLLAQNVGRMAWVLDEYFEGDSGTSELAIEWLCKHPLGKFVAGGAIDVRAKDPAALWRNGEILSKMARKGISLNSRNVPIPAGIDRVNTMLFSQNYDRTRTPASNLMLIGKRAGIPLLYINGKCQRLIWEMTEGYRYPKDGDGVTGNLPIDKHNHAAKALAYGLVDEFGFVTRSGKQPSGGVDMFKRVRNTHRLSAEEVQAMQDAKTSNFIAARLARAMGVGRES
ncbi:MAG TPA: hypothetical protein VGQ96_00290, partial [Candidatus Eremiobacteraceae bacterium]|nr:hypothetical protein [Candidatus Eremiobacteraceae bacterium]